MAYVERLWPGVLGWVGVLAFAAMVGVALIPVDTVLALVVAVVLALGGLGLVALATPRVEVSRGTLRAGAAHIPTRLLGPARVLDADQLRTELGPGLDARAHVCLRGWIHTAVRVELRDPQDPTPYWIVSTRRPQALLAALGAAPAEQPTR